MSGLLLWSSRPGNAWSGMAAARFAAGVILVVQALFSLLHLQLPYEVRLLPQQLSLYAALPLLVSTLLASALNYHWSRLIWGRILLALCVVFELMRRFNELSLLLWITLGGAALSALPLIPRQKQQGTAALLCWAGLGFWLYQTGPRHSDINLWLAVTLIPVMYLQRR